MNNIQNRGITLIALIITVIVLLILAGVTISMTMGENGIIRRITESAKEIEIAGIKEQIGLDIISNQIGRQITDENIDEILSKHGELIKEDGKTTGVKTHKGYEILLEDIWSEVRVTEGTNIIPEPNIPSEPDIPSGPTFTTVANAPNISGFNKTSTYYVAWDITSSPYAIDDGKLISGIAPENWYDYTAEVNKWANVKTVGGGNDCYWVWIPRYAYKVPTRTLAGTIEIKFLEGITNDTIDGSSITISNNTTQGNWNVSPAFWWDENNDGVRATDNSEELSGIWVAKFEASSSNVSAETLTEDLKTTGGGNVNTLQVRVIPNVTSWRSINVNNIFTVCGNLTKIGNSLEGATNIDSHMMKNSEWGAVAYLSRSVYGKNSAVWNNPYYTNTTNDSSITGLAGATQNASQTNLTNTYKYNEDNGANARGANASTTGNVYGIYDMAGGATENVAGYLSNISALAGYTILANADNKYKDKYAGISATDTSNYNVNTNKYGDAMYEISKSGTGTTSWDLDVSYYTFSTMPVVSRGGRSEGGTNSGVFAFSRNTGGAYPHVSFRPILISL